MGRLILWNKLGSKYQVEHSEVGTDLIEASSPAYQPGKFGKGTYSSMTADTTAPHIIPGGNLNLRKFTMEFWFKRTEAFISTNIMGWIVRKATTGNNWVSWTCNYNAVGGGGPYSTNMGVSYAAATWVSLYYHNPGSAEAMEAFLPLDEWVHLAATFDYGLPLTAKIRMFRNGVELSSTKFIESEVNTPGIAGDMYLGIATYTTAKGMGGVLDNFKWYDYIKTDFSDRFWEGYPPVMEQQFDQADKAPAVYEHTSYLSGKGVEVDIPEPEHHLKMNEKAGDKIIDYGTNPVHAVNHGAHHNNGNGYILNGVSSYILIPDDDSWSYGNGVKDDPFTFTAWIYMDDPSVRGCVILGKGKINTLFEYIFYYGRTAGLRCIIGDQSIASCHTSKRSSPSGLADNDTQRWIFVAVTYDGRGTAYGMDLYWDGNRVDAEIKEVSASSSYVAMENLTSTVRIGTSYDLDGWDSGKVDSIRAYRQKLNHAQVRAIYEQERGDLIETDIPTPDHHYPLESLVITDKGKGSLILPEHYYALDETQQAVISMDGGISPGNGTNSNITAGNTGKYRTAYSFNGTSSTVSVPISNSTVYSVAMWFKANVIEVAGVFSSGTTTPYKPSIMVNTLGRIQVVTRGADPYYNTPNDTYKVGEWCHVVLVVDGTAIKFYVNGELIITQTAGDAPETDTVHLIGSRIGEYWFDGLIDEVKWYDRTLLQQEIISIMNDTDPRRLAYGTLSATPPTLVYDSEMGECLEFGDAGPNNINLGDALAFEGTDIFEISLWFNTVKATSQTFICREYYTPFQGWEYSMNAGQVIFHLFNTTTIGISTVTVDAYNDGNWHHALISYDGSQKASGIAHYIDGNKVPFTVSLDNLTGSTVPSVSAYIGHLNGAAQPYEGRLKDIKVWKK